MKWEYKEFTKHHQITEFINKHNLKDFKITEDTYGGLIVWYKYSKK